MGVPVMSSDRKIAGTRYAPEHGVEEDDRHADEHAGRHLDLEEAAEDDTHAPHLAGHVGERDEDRAHDRDDARGL